MESNPRYLYRGIIVSYDKFDDIAFGDTDMFPPKDEILEENGRKFIKDDNEYGIYLSDNPYLVRTYSKPLKSGKALSKDVDFDYGNGREFVTFPLIGISYDVDTKDLNVRVPWITDEIKEIYDKGFEGSEWIVDMVPKDKYSITRVIVGSDLLHDMEIVELGSIEDIKRNIKRIFDVRERHLKDLVNELNKLTPKKRMALSPLEMHMFKTLLGNNGSKYSNVNVENKTIETLDDAIHYLMSLYYFNNTQRLDFNNLCYIESLRSRLNGNNEVEDLLNLLYVDMNEFMDKEEDISVARNKFMMLKILNNQLEKIESMIEDDSNNEGLKKKRDIILEQIDLIDR